MRTKHDYDLLDQHFRVRLASGTINAPSSQREVVAPVREIPSPPVKRPVGRPRTRWPFKKPLRYEHRDAIIGGGT